MASPHLLVFGPGYSATGFVDRALSSGWKLFATYRDAEKKSALEARGITPIKIETDYLNTDSIDHVTHILSSIAPNEQGDPVFSAAKKWLMNQKTVEWIGYLSATNVYGNFDGDWVDEDTKPEPTLDRGRRRLKAEQNWQALGKHLGARTHVYRLAGIYGPGRNTVRNLKNGTAKRIDKPGHFFSRIHVDDITNGLWRGATGNCPSMVFNMADDDPRPQESVVSEAAKAMNISPPKLVHFADADMSSTAKSFYQDNKRVKNDRVKNMLGLTLKYPTFTSALEDLIKSEK